MAKHTPGPWLVSASGPTVYAIHGEPQRNRFSAHVQAGRRDDADSDECAANARLIATAADLLDALKLVASLPGFEPAEPYAGKVLAAIAKAEGTPL